MKRAILATLALLLLAACAPRVPEDGSQGIALQHPPNMVEAWRSEGAGAYSVSRFVDHEADVICWVFFGPNKGGISCIPIPALSIRAMRNLTGD
jgi:hypothetical protein